MRIIKDFFGGLVDILFPRSCLACDVSPLDEGRIFCSLCRLTLDEVPTVVELPETWSVNRLLSPLAYGGALAEAVIRCKHGGMPGFARPLARFAAGNVTFPSFDIIIPVPLHRKRLAARGFNQSALMAGTLSSLTGVAWSPSILRRTRDTPSQGGRSRAERLKNMKGAFNISRKNASRLSGEKVLLVDDVWTTGATCRACATALHRAGAREVIAFTLCRVTS